MKMKFLLLVVLGIIVCCHTAEAQAWQSKASLNFPRHGACAAALNGSIYVFGGGNSLGDYVIETEVYDPINDTWSIKASIPSPRGEMACAAVNGKIYVIGGYNPALPSSSNPPGALNIVEEYDPESDTWITKSPMPDFRSTISASVINDKIYVTGDWPTASGELNVYDPATDTWTTGTSCPTGRMNANSSAAFGNDYYFIGGKIASLNGDNTSVISSKNERYDTNTGLWQEKADLPQASFNGSATLIENQIHYLGGIIGYQPYVNTDSHFVYDIPSDTWLNGTSLTFSRDYHVSILLNSQLFIIGGRDSQLTSTDVVEALELTNTDIITRGKNEFLKIFPNPTCDFITIQYENANLLNGCHITIENSLGQQIFKKTISQQIEKISLSSLGGNGLYFVHLNDSVGNTIGIQKIALQGH